MVVMPSIDSDGEPFVSLLGKTHIPISPSVLLVGASLSRCFSVLHFIPYRGLWFLVCGTEPRQSILHSDYNTPSSSMCWHKDADSLAFFKSRTWKAPETHSILTLFSLFHESHNSISTSPMMAQLTLFAHWPHRSLKVWRGWKVSYGSDHTPQPTSRRASTPLYPDTPIFFSNRSATVALLTGSTSPCWVPHSLLRQHLLEISFRPLNLRH